METGRHACILPLEQVTGKVSPESRHTNSVTTSGLTNSGPATKADMNEGIYLNRYRFMYKWICLQCFYVCVHAWLGLGREANPLITST